MFLGDRKALQGLKTQLHPWLGSLEFLGVSHEGQNVTTMLLLIFSIYFSSFCCFVGVGGDGEWYFRSSPLSLGPGSSRRAVPCWHTQRQQSLAVHLGLMGDMYGQTA